MNRSSLLKYTIQCLFLLGGLISSARLFAQQQDSTWASMDYIRNANVWISSGSVTGLTHLPVQKISNASLSFTKDDGSFRNFYQSSNSYNIRAVTESFYRMNRAVVVHGKVSYEHFNGKNMTGSAFIDPYKNPLDIDEMADSNAGTKKLERYQLMGAISAGITRRLTIGGKVVYEAANYAKTKDLRHTNNLMNLQATVGAAYRIGQSLEIGADYSYERRIEKVNFAVHGNTDRQYISLINFGSFYGFPDLFSDHSFVVEPKPMVNNNHTGSVYMGLSIKPGVEWFNRVSYGKRKGYFGIRGTSKIVYTEHSANQYAYEGVFSLKKLHTTHNISLKAGYEDLTNGENIYRSETSSAGNTVIVYYGRTDVLQQELRNVDLDYTGYLGVKDNNPLWTLRAGTSYSGRQQTVNRYPFYRKQDINSYRIYAGAARNIIHRKNMFTLSFGMLYGAGSGTAKTDGFFVPPSSSQVPPATKDDYLYREFEYLTKPRVQVEPGVRYSFIPEKNITAFIQLSYQYTKAFDVQYTGNRYSVVSLAVGCSF